MNLKDYITNKTEEFAEDVSGVENIYYKYFHRECNIAFAVTLASAIAYGSSENNYLFITHGLLVADITIRAIKGNHGRKAESGLIGLVREIYSNHVPIHK